MSDAREKPVNLGRYTLLSRIASGGMGTVHVGRVRGERGFTRPVAIKLLHPHLAEDPGVVVRFLDEARVASHVKHPHVVSVLDVGESDGRPFLVLEYVHGESLEFLLRAAQCGKEWVPLDVISAILSDVLEGLHAAHQAVDGNGTPLGVVHRDVSPHNVLVSSQGAAYVTDFGIAKVKDRVRLTATNDVLGKVGYMAPEQLAAGPQSAATDIYGAGVVLWEALAGRKLYDGIEEQMRTSMEGKGAPSPCAFRADVPRELDALVQSMLARDPRARPRSALVCAETLSAAVPRASAARVAEWVLTYARARLDRLEEALRDTRVDLTPAAVEAVPSVVSPTSESVGTPRRSRRAAMVMGIALLVSAAFALGIVLARSPNATAGASTTTQPLAVPPAVSAAETPPPSGGEAPLSPAAEPATVAPPITPPPAAANRGQVRRSPPPHPPAPACEPPYVVVDGIKQWKRECFGTRGR